MFILVSRLGTPHVVILAQITRLGSLALQEVLGPKASFAQWLYICELRRDTYGRGRLITCWALSLLLPELSSQLAPPP